MVFENFPYTNMHDLNLDWIIKEMKKLSAEWDSLRDIYINFAADLTHIENTLDNHESRIGYLEQITDMQSDSINRLGQAIIELDSEIESVKGNLNDAIVYLENKINQAIEENDLYMYSPFTGLYVPVETVIQELASLHMANAITAGDYDAAEITAGAYDALELTAITYDSSADLYI